MSFEPRQFVATYKPEDNSGNKAGIFQELEEGELRFITVQDNQVGVTELPAREMRWIEEIEGYGIQAAATVYMKAGIQHTWTDDARQRIMDILDLPVEFVVTREAQGEQA